MFFLNHRQWIIIYFLGSRYVIYRTDLYYATGFYIKKLLQDRASVRKAPSTRTMGVSCKKVFFLKAA